MQTTRRSMEDSEVHPEQIPEKEVEDAAIRTNGRGYKFPHTS